MKDVRLLVHIKEFNVCNVNLIVWYLWIRVSLKGPLSAGKQDFSNQSVRQLIANCTVHSSPIGVVPFRFISLYFIHTVAIRLKIQASRIGPILLGSVSQNTHILYYNCAFNATSFRKLTKNYIYMIDIYIYIYIYIYMFFIK